MLKIDLDERAEARALDDVPERIGERLRRGQGAGGDLGFRRTARLPVVAAFGQEGVDVGDVRALGVAVEIDAQQRGIAGGCGKLPEQGLGRCAGIAGRKRELAGQR